MVLIQLLLPTTGADGAMTHIAAPPGMLPHREHDSDDVRHGNLLRRDLGPARVCGLTGLAGAGRSALTGVTAFACDRRTGHIALAATRALGTGAGRARTDERLT